MSISRQLTSKGSEELESNGNEETKGPRARTRRLMLVTAIQLMQSGLTPSVSDVSEAAGVSRATAYRYFPNQAALAQAVIRQALGPISRWKSTSEGVEERVSELLEYSMPRLEEFEATFRIVLKLSLEMKEHHRAGLVELDAEFKRGHRLKLLDEALEPLKAKLDDEEYSRLLHGLAMLFGVEAIVVMKDISGLEAPETTELVVWAAKAMVRQALGKLKGDN